MDPLKLDRETESYRMFQETRMHHPLQDRLALAFAVLGLAAAGLAALALYSAARLGLREVAYHRLAGTASLSAALVDASDPQAMQISLQKLALSGGNIRQVFVLATGDDGMVYRAAAASIGGTAPAPGEKFLTGLPDMAAALSGLQTPLVEKHMDRQAGEPVLRAYAPLNIGETNRPVLGLTVAVPELEKQERALTMLALGILAVGLLIFPAAGWKLGEIIDRPTARLTEDVERIARGDLGHRIPIQPGDPSARLAQAINAIAAQWNETLNNREQTVVARSQELARRTGYLEAGAELGKLATSDTSVEELLRQAVTLIGQRFDLYYVGLFELDESRDWAVLKAGTGQAGKAMLVRGHKIRVGTGMVGWCIANGRPRIALQVSEDEMRLQPPELPETRSEVALPLRSRGQVLGALSLQSQALGAFDRTTLAALQGMVDLVATTLDLVRIQEKYKESVQRLQSAEGESSQKSWRQMLQGRRITGYRKDLGGLSPLLAVKSADPRWAQPVSSEAAPLPELNLPIKMRGQVLGSLAAHKPSGAGEWTNEEIQVIEAVVEQLAVAVESARLYGETQRRAERERLAGEITARLRQSNDPQEILQTAVQELRQALGVRRSQELARAGQEIEEKEQQP